MASIKYTEKFTIHEVPVNEIMDQEIAQVKRHVAPCRPQARQGRQGPEGAGHGAAMQNGGVPICQAAGVDEDTAIVHRSTIECLVGVGPLGLGNTPYSAA